MNATGSGTDLEEETEDVLVYMDFNTNIEDGFFSLEKDFKIIGMESEEPILQLGPQLYQGEWKDSVGTYLFFEETGESSPAEDPLFSENIDKNLRFCFKTDKLLHMSRIFVKPAGENITDSPTEEGSSEKNDVTASESPKECIF